MAIVAIAPLPFASNRPFFWAAWAAAISALLAIHFAFGSQGRSANAAKLAAMRIPIALWLTLIAWCLIQAVPMGWLPANPADTGDALAFRSISVSPALTVLAAIRLFTYGAFFYLVVATVTGLGVSRIANFLLFIIGFYAFYSLIELYILEDRILLFEKWAYKGMATGPFVSRNSFATFLAFGIVTGFSQLYEAQFRGVGRRSVTSTVLLQAALTALIAVALLATQSRMGLLVAASGVFVVALAHRLSREGANRSFIRLVGGSIVAAVAVLYLYGDDLLQRLSTTGEGLEARTGLYKQVLQMIAARPWTGYGGGTFEYIFPLFHDRELSTDLIWDKAHSTYLALAADYGVLLGTLPLLILCYFGIRIFADIRVAYSANLGRLIALGGLAVAAVHSTIDFSLEIQANMFVLLLMIGIGFDRSPRSRSKL